MDETAASGGPLTRGRVGALLVLLCAAVLGYLAVVLPTSLSVQSDDALYRPGFPPLPQAILGQVGLPATLAMLVAGLAFGALSRRPLWALSISSVVLLLGWRVFDLVRAPRPVYLGGFDLLTAALLGAPFALGVFAIRTLVGRPRVGGLPTLRWSAGAMLLFLAQYFVVSNIQLNPWFMSDIAYRYNEKSLLQVMGSTAHYVSRISRAVLFPLRDVVIGGLQANGRGLKGVFATALLDMSPAGDRDVRNDVVFAIANSALLLAVAWVLGSLVRRRRHPAARSRRPSVPTLRFAAVILGIFAVLAFVLHARHSKLFLGGVDRLLRQGDYISATSAEVLARWEVAWSPQDVQARMALGRTLLAVGDLSAKRQFDQALVLDPALRGAIASLYFGTAERSYNSDHASSRQELLRRTLGEAIRLEPALGSRLTRWALEEVRWASAGERLHHAQALIEVCAEIDPSVRLPAAEALVATARRLLEERSFRDASTPARMAVQLDRRTAEAAAPILVAEAARMYIPSDRDRISATLQEALLMDSSVAKGEDFGWAKEVKLASNRSAACDAIRSYIRRFPRGAHLAEADWLIAGCVVEPFLAAARSSPRGYLDPSERLPEVAARAPRTSREPWRTIAVLFDDKIVISSVEERIDVTRVRGYVGGSTRKEHEVFRRFLGWNREPFNLGTWDDATGLDRVEWIFWSDRIVEANRVREMVLAARVGRE